MNGIAPGRPRALAAAATGVAAPVLLAIALLALVFGESARVGLAAGAALAPTSLGFSAKLLAEVGQLESDEGMLICVAAVVDDVIALVLLTEIQVGRSAQAPGRGPCVPGDSWGMGESGI